MIRFLIHTVSSRADVYGNRYHVATVTSTKSGRSFLVQNVGGEGNIPGLLREYGFEWNELNSTREELPIRQWNARYGKLELGVRRESQVTRNDLVRLEQPIA